MAVDWLTASLDLDLWLLIGGMPLLYLDLWLEWLKDETKQDGEGSTEDKEYITSLFNRAVQDYACNSLLQFSIFF